MSYSLARMIRRTGTRRKSITLRPIEPTQSLALDLATILDAPVRAWKDRSDRILVAYDRALALRTTRDARVTDTPQDIENEIDAAGDEISRLILTLTPQLRDWTIKVEKWHRRKFIAAVLSPTGVNLEDVLGADRETMEAFRRGILEKIRNIDEDTRGRIAEAVWRGFQERTPRRQVAREIAKATQITRKRALFIASDQTTKMSARLDQARAEEAGIEEYEWMKSGKLHPRKAHVERDGKIYRYDDPPPGGHPGSEPNCGCKGRAHLNLD